MRTTADHISVWPAARSPSTSRRLRDLLPNHSSPPERFEVVHLTAECWPFARTGGLGEAVAGLAASQAAAGIGVIVVMPLYRAVRASVPHLQPVGTPFRVPVGTHDEEVQLFRAAHMTGSPRVFFIAHPFSFDRDGIYGEAGADYPDNARRFALFSRAAIRALSRIAPHPRVVQAHDWHSALALAELRFRDRFDHSSPRPLAVLSVHNAGFQGSFPPENTSDLLPDVWRRATELRSSRGVNFLEIGLAYCDLAVTVSPNHARELRTREGGFGLHETFAALGTRLVGIANGIDAERWDPARDTALPVQFSGASLAGKAACKTALQQSCGLEERADVPLFAMCTRLAQQKGLDLVLDANLPAQRDAQFVFVGRGEPRYERALAELAAAAPGRVALRLDFSDELEHRLLAGADALLMPSFYEPCGLTQMRAQRYGTIPVARSVGGLVDSIDDDVTGFLFGDYTREAFLAAIWRARERYADAARWREMMQRAMRRDFGWGRASDTYIALYRRSLSGATSRRAPASLGAEV